MYKIPDTPICQVVVVAHNICLETAITVLNIRGAPTCLNSLGKALENLAITIRKLDFAWHHHEEACFELIDQNARQTLLGALRGSTKVYEAALNILSGHMCDTSTPHLRTFHEDKCMWQEKDVLDLIQRTDAYKLIIDRTVLLAL